MPSFNIHQHHRSQSSTFSITTQTTKDRNEFCYQVWFLTYSLNQKARFHHFSSNSTWNPYTAASWSASELEKQRKQTHVTEAGNHQRLRLRWTQHTRTHPPTCPLPLASQVTVCWPCFLPFCMSLYFNTSEKSKGHRGGQRSAVCVWERERCQWVTTPKLHALFCWKKSIHSIQLSEGIENGQVEEVGGHLERLQEKTHK